MLGDVIGVLQCPLCGAGFVSSGSSLVCERHHSFDVGRQGYASLLSGDANLGTADTQQMVMAREAFLATGEYEPIAHAVAECARQAVARAPGVVVDVGAGTGYYLSACLEAVPDRLGVALDLSKYAARRAARAHPRIGAVVCDAWRTLPLKSGAASVVLDVFAPRNAAETQRALHPNGALVVVTPTQEHLAELVSALSLLSVDEAKESRLDAALSGHFSRASSLRVRHVMSLSHESIQALVSMGPSTRHVSAEDLREGILGLPEPMSVTLSVQVATYHPIA